MIKRVGLDDAAYYLLYGAQIIKFIGKLGEGVYCDIEISDKVLEDIRKQPLVNYRVYMKKRKKIKQQIKKSNHEFHVDKQNYGKRYFQQKRDRTNPY